MSKQVRMGIVGVGNMGGFHADYMNQVPNAVLAAICDTDAVVGQKRTDKHQVPYFKTHQEMLAAGVVDAILIATPHYDHVPIALDAFAANVHVLCEKPVSVGVASARMINEAYTSKYSHLKFGLMFQQRTSPAYQKLRQLISEGELGEISRITWIVTNWFRTWSYYASGGWRATWGGEGGGVLINQCPHNLDLMQWLMGGMMPTKVTAIANIGKTHPIEVEDEVSALLEYGNGAIGHFITTTGEAPGTNRLEICGEQGKIIAEHGKLHFSRTRKNVRTVRETDPASFASVEVWEIEVPPAKSVEAHKTITDKFVGVIVNDLPNDTLIAPGTEGVKGLELGNAMLLSGVTHESVSLPIDGAKYDQLLLDLAKQYAGRKVLKEKAAGADMAGSFQK